MCLICFFASNLKNMVFMLINFYVVHYMYNTSMQSAVMENLWLYIDGYLSKHGRRKAVNLGVPVSQQEKFSGKILNPIEDS